MKLRIQFVILFLLLLAMGQAQSIMQKPKRIYITLDVSGSMKGNKYIMANYAAQSIAVFSTGSIRSAEGRWL